MNDSALYTNAKGQPVTHSSYSARQTFKKCPKEFELTRIQGWSDKERRAAPIFGKCIEAGVQFYEDSDRRSGAGVERFTEMWQDVKNLPEFPQLKFTDSEGDWESLVRAGVEMMRLYEVRAPFLPVSTHPKALWQQTLRKKIFPGTELDALENKAILDLLSFPRWNHPKLLKINDFTDCNDCAVRWSCSLEADGPAFEPCETHRVRPLIIDIKTSGGDLETDLLVLDPQLTEYAWQGRIPDISFLWFVKRGHDLRKGSRVSLLEDIELCNPAEDKVVGWFAGYELQVICLGDNGTVYVGESAALAEYEKAVKGLRGKARDAAEMAHLITAMDAGTVAAVNQSLLTKQRIQFAAARLSTQDMNDIGRDVAQTTVEMVRAHREGYYPKLAGIRFPNEKCNYCAMRWICLNRPQDRDQKLSRRGEEWLDGIEEE